MRQLFRPFPKNQRLSDCKSGVSVQVRARRTSLVTVISAVCALIVWGTGVSAQSATAKKPASTAGSSTPASKVTTATQTRSSLAKARAAAAERARKVAASRAKERARVELEA